MCALQITRRSFFRHFLTFLYEIHVKFLRRFHPSVSLSNNNVWSIAKWGLLNSFTSCCNTLFTFTSIMMSFSLTLLSLSLFLCFALVGRFWFDRFFCWFFCCFVGNSNFTHVFEGFIRYFYGIKIQNAATCCFPYFSIRSLSAVSVAVRTLHAENRSSVCRWNLNNEGRKQKKRKKNHENGINNRKISAKRNVLHIFQCGRISPRKQFNSIFYGRNVLPSGHIRHCNSLLFSAISFLRTQTTTHLPYIRSEKKSRKKNIETMSWPTVLLFLILYCSLCGNLEKMFTSQPYDYYSESANEVEKKIRLNINPHTL